MPFKSAYLKLTAFYVLIVMIISSSFSVAIYQISSKVIDQGLGRQTMIIRNMPLNTNAFFQDLERIRAEQLEESSNHLKLNLVYFNLIILILSTLLSYFFARRTLRPLEEAMEAQNRFTADASHELRTPLTAMRSEIEVNLRDKNMGLLEARELLSSNLEEVEKLERLSNSLLKIAKIDNAVQHKFANISIGEVLAEAYGKIESLAGIKSINFKNDSQDIRIKADHQNLVELFVILFDNAIKYSPKHSEISITVEKYQAAAIIYIKDQGVGIKQSDQPHIFDRFYRADHSRSKDKIDGYGLGLSIAKSIVDLHHGNISVKSSPGKGSEFVVKLPLVK